MKDKIITYSDELGFWFLCLMVFFLGFAKAGVTICSGIAFVAFVVKKTLSHKLEFRSYLPKTDLNLPIICFFLACVISIFGSMGVPKSLWALFFKTGRGLMLYFMAVDMVSSKKRLHIILIFLLVSAALVGLSGIWQQFTGVDFLRGHGVVYKDILDASTSSFDYHSIFGGYLTIVLPLVMALILYKEIKRLPINIAIGLLTVLLLTSLAVTYCRGAWVGFLAGLAFMMVYQFMNLPARGRIVLVSIMLGLLAAFVIILMTILPVSFKERVLSIIRMEDSSRIYLWKWTIKWTMERPIFGYGLGVYMDKSWSVYAHNCYLQLATETGIVGLATFLWILARLYRTGVRTLSEKKDYLLLGLMSGITGFLVHSFFDVNFYSLQLSVLIWFTIGLAVSVQRLLNQSSTGVTSGQ